MRPVPVIAAPADVHRSSAAFSDYLRLPPRVRAALLRNLRLRLETRGLAHRALLRDPAVVRRSVAFLLGDGAR